MGHLFAVEEVSPTNPGPFLNVQGRQYWSSRSYSSEPDLAWYVHFGNGDQAVTGKSDSHIPWAVRDGDVGSEVSIDTKPDSFLVRGNLGSHGSTPVTVLGSVLPNDDDIDVNTLTLTLGTAGVKAVGRTDRTLCDLQDVVLLGFTLRLDRERGCAVCDDPRFLDLLRLRAAMTVGHQLSLVALLIGSVGLAGCAAPEPGTAEP